MCFGWCKMLVSGPVWGLRQAGSVGWWGHRREVTGTIGFWAIATTAHGYNLVRHHNKGKAEVEERERRSLQAELATAASSTATSSTARSAGQVSAAEDVCHNNSAAPRQGRRSRDRKQTAVAAANCVPNGADSILCSLTSHFL